MAVAAVAHQSAQEKSQAHRTEESCDTCRSHAAFRASAVTGILFIFNRLRRRSSVTTSLPRRYFEIFGRQYAGGPFGRGVGVKRYLPMIPNASEQIHQCFCGAS